MKNAQALKTLIGRQVAIDPTEGGCFEWLGETDDFSQPLATWKAETRLVVEWAWLLKYDEIPDGHTIIHMCDGGPSCVNVEHLELLPTDS